MINNNIIYLRNILKLKLFFSIVHPICENRNRIDTKIDWLIIHRRISFSIYSNRFHLLLLIHSIQFIGFK